MHLLFETASGIALFKVHDESKLRAADLVTAAIHGADDLQRLVSLITFLPFDSIATALPVALERHISQEMKQMLQKYADKELLVQDPHLAVALRQACEITASCTDAGLELSRAVRAHLATLIPDFSAAHDAQMALGLAHAMSRHQIKFSAESIDVMLIQAISLIDETEKEANQYAMRLREWMCWHFPELSGIVPNGVDYARVIICIRDRRHLCAAMAGPERDEFIAALDEASHNQTHAIHQAALTSMGTDITLSDTCRLVRLAEEFLDLTTYREELVRYVETRMLAVAPNFTKIVGPLVGVRLLAKAGGLLSLAKLPASTIQILGAERALFRAKKAGSKQTPKYGFIYHAFLIDQASVPNRGKMARVLAANASLAARVDALSESPNPTFADIKLDRIQAALRYYEGDKQARVNRKSIAAQKMKAYQRGAAVEYGGTDMRLKKDAPGKTRGPAEGEDETEAPTNVMKPEHKPTMEPEPEPVTEPAPTSSSEKKERKHKHEDHSEKKEKREKDKEKGKDKEKRKEEKEEKKKHKEHRKHKGEE